MPRQSAIRPKQVKIPPKRIPENGVTSIRIDCMYGCGQKVVATVAAADIVPSLGRPRGFRKSCNVCDYYRKTSGMIPGTEMH